MKSDLLLELADHLDGIPASTFRWHDHFWCGSAGCIIGHAWFLHSGSCKPVSEYVYPAWFWAFYEIPLRQDQMGIIFAPWDSLGTIVDGDGILLDSNSFFGVRVKDFECADSREAANFVRMVVRRLDPDAWSTWQEAQYELQAPAEAPQFSGQKSEGRLVSADDLG